MRSINWLALEGAEFCGASSGNGRAVAAGVATACAAGWAQTWPMPQPNTAASVAAVSLDICLAIGLRPPSGTVKVGLRMGRL